MNKTYSMIIMTNEEKLDKLKYTLNLKYTLHIVNLLEEHY